MESVSLFYSLDEDAVDFIPDHERKAAMMAILLAKKRASLSSLWNTTIHNKLLSEMHMITMHYR